MSGSHGVVLVACLLMLTAFVAESTVIIVGGNTGWTTGFNYDSWLLAQNIQPRVDDSLVFRNQDSLMHTVAMLSSLDAYQMCILGGATNITPINPGTNFTYVIPSSLEGQTLYIVCTITGHCTDNQKISSTVLAASTNGTTPSTPSSPGASPSGNDADMNRIICWTTAILLIAACFWNLG